MTGSPGITQNWKLAIRRDGSGWAVWSNRTEAWQALPERFANLPETAARGYAVGFYGCGAGQIRLEAPAQ